MAIPLYEPATLPLAGLHSYFAVNVADWVQLGYFNHIIHIVIIIIIIFPYKYQNKEKNLYGIYIRRFKINKGASPVVDRR